MNIRPAILAALCATTLVHTASAATNGTQPATTSANTIVIAEAWIRATAAGIPVTAGYFTVLNRGREADTLLAISSPIATKAELHRTLEAGGMSHMRPAGEVTIAAGKTLTAAPGGLHIMFFGLARPLEAGTRVPLTLTFRRAGSLTVLMTVNSLTAAPASHHSATH